MGRKSACVSADMTVWRDAQNVGHAALELFGKVDVLINSASSFVPHAFFEVTEQDVDLEFGVHVKGVTALSQVIGRHMIERDAALGGGHIVNMVDLGAFIDANDYVMHNLAKGALEHLSHVMAIALAPRVRVNTVCPGPILKVPSYSDAQWESLRKTNLLGEIGDPDQITATILFLLTGPRFITGTCIRVDGGQMLARDRLH
jgi:pteridine reductase